jgi:hypothetical protein
MNKYKVYKITSKNSNEYYINFTEKKNLVSIINNYVLEYVSFVLNNKLTFKKVFNIIDNNDISIELLSKIDNADLVKQYIDNYIENNKNIVQKENIIKNNFKEINIIKLTKNRADYFKNYYSKNKNTEEIKTKNKEYYEKNKSTIKNKINKQNKNKKNTEKLINHSKNVLDLIENN